jgi:hypothetical protein
LTPCFYRSRILLTTGGTMKQPKDYEEKLRFEDKLILWGCALVFFVVFILPEIL